MTAAEDFTHVAEVLLADAHALPNLLAQAVEGTAQYARLVTELVQDMDHRRAALSDVAVAAGGPALPDFVTAAVPRSDPALARLLTAARRGPAAAAVALGKAARRPALDTPSGPAPDPVPEVEFTDAAIDDAGQAATGLLTALHHSVHDLQASEILGAADPVAVSAVLAGVVLDLAERVVPDVGAWLRAMAAENARAEG